MAIKHAGLKAVLVALSLLIAPSAFSQPAGGEEDTADEEDAADGEDGGEDSGEEGDDDDDDADDDDDDDEDELGEDESVTSGLDELCELDPDSCVQIDFAEQAKKDVQAEMYAVQQIWALRASRFEVNVGGGFTLNDQFVSHPSIQLAANYYILNELAVGANGNIYQGLNAESDFNFETSRAARVGLPITEYGFNVMGNVTYVPAYGKFAAFQDFIFHYDFYVLVGGGVTSTRPIAVVDPDNRTFDFKIRPTVGAGGGIRIFFTRWLAANIEVRDYIIIGDELENPGIATGRDANGDPNAANPDTWLAEDSTVTNNVQAQVGLSFFLPPTWEYQLPK